MISADAGKTNLDRHIVHAENGTFVVQLRVLMEMRPALDGFAGIPQETRLLFCGLCKIPGIHLEGLLQTSLRFLAPGSCDARDEGLDTAESERINRYSRLVLAIDAKPPSRLWAQTLAYIKRRRASYGLALSSLVPGKRAIPLTLFEPEGFENFLWESFFAKSLHENDRLLVTGKQYRVCTIPWNILHSAGLITRRFAKRTRYPKVDTKETDIVIAQTPYPGRLGPRTSLVVRYHDALPIFMPHAFANKVRHQTTHFRALESNVLNGAYFACVSESTRQDLIRIFPQAASRAVTIHNMVSHHYYEEDVDAASVPEIIKSRLNLATEATTPRCSSTQEEFYGNCLRAAPMRYLLMVATIEPRKNHNRLIAAYEMIRARRDPSLKLVIVGSLGWDTAPILQEMRAGIDRGTLFVLNKVPAADLRILYRHAAATVCPSVAEGFDFPGVEAMRCGGIVVASDIAVHREVFDNAAEYFDAYSTRSLVNAIERVLYDKDAHERTRQLKERGRAVSSRYLPERILPQWEAFLARVANERAVAQPGKRQ